MILHGPRTTVRVWQCDVTGNHGTEALSACRRRLRRSRCSRRWWNRSAVGVMKMRGSQRSYRAHPSSARTQGSRTFGKKELYSKPSAPRLTRTGFFTAAIAGVDLALWDIRGKFTSQAAYRLSAASYRDKVVGLQGHRRRRPITALKRTR